MLSAISFKNNTNIENQDKVSSDKKVNVTQTKTENTSSTEAKSDEVIISTKEKLSEIKDIAEKGGNILHKTVKTFAEARKTYVTIKEGLFGVITAVSAGMATGAGILSLDWFITRLSGHGDKSQSLLKTPAKAVGKAFLGVGKKLCSVWNSTIKDIVKYPFVGFPKDISNYIKNLKGISPYGKNIAVGLGIAATCVSAACTLVKINKARAEVDHGFRIGHNK